MANAPAAASGIPPEFLHQLANGSYVNRGQFITFGPESNCTLDLCSIDWTVYKYRPSLPANVIFIVLYVIAMLVHIYLGVRWRSWGFMILMICGCIWAIVGYVGRLILFMNPWSFQGFLIQIICITGAPVFFTAAIYVTLSRAIHFYAPELSRFSPRLFYWVFIAADIFCLVLQAVGGALSTTSDGSSKTAVNLALAGLSLQVIVLLIFCGFFADYMFRYIKSERGRVGKARSALGKRQRIFFAGLAAAIVLILARCGYRVDELSEGYQGSTKLTKEGLFIGLEGVLVIVAVFCLFFGHPGFGFHGNERRTSEANAQETVIEPK